MMRNKFALIGLVVVLILGIVPIALAIEHPDRGRYIYDDAGRLSVEPEIALSSYLWRLDSKTDYEVVLVFPEAEMAEQEIIDWFNNHGVGKKEIDNGAAIFVFPDSSVFVAIGSGNDKVSVAYSKTHGERIFKSFEDDPVLTLMRFIDTLGKKINAPSGAERAAKFGEAVVVNLGVILLWGLVVALGILLINTVKDGFQGHDLILPGIVLVGLLIFVGVSAINVHQEQTSYKTYGCIVSTDLDEEPGTHPVIVSTGKNTTTVIYVPHVDFINNATFLSYEFKSYPYRFVSRDNKEAWKHKVGELDGLVIGIEKGNLRGVRGLNDNSGGKTIGDGVWINR